jgi:hypothetical protein
VLSLPFSLDLLSKSDIMRLNVGKGTHSDSAVGYLNAVSQGVVWEMMHHVLPVQRLSLCNGHFSENIFIVCKVVVSIVHCV